MSKLLTAVRLGRWFLLLLAVSGTVGCAGFRDHDDCDDEGDEYANYHRGGGLSPGRLNLATAYRNG